MIWASILEWQQLCDVEICLFSANTLPGNRQSLETHPKEMDIDVREELLRFHSTHYSSNLMTLVVLGRETLDELAGWIQGLFSPVINNNFSITEYSDHPFSDNELQVHLPLLCFRCELCVQHHSLDVVDRHSCGTGSSWSGFGQTSFLHRFFACTSHNLAGQKCVS